MRTLVLLCCLALSATLFSSTAAAQESAQALGTCLGDNTTGKDRKDLARWIFAAMATHPEIASLSVVTDSTVAETSQVVGVLFTRLLAEACAAEARAAMQSGGAGAIETAFGFLGQLAMQELMTNEQVAAALGGLERFVDVARLEAALGQ